MISASLASHRRRDYAPTSCAQETQLRRDFVRSAVIVGSLAPGPSPMLVSDLDQADTCQAEDSFKSSEVSQARPGDEPLVAGATAAQSVLAGVAHCRVILDQPRQATHHDQHAATTQDANTVIVHQRSTTKRSSMLQHRRHGTSATRQDDHTTTHIVLPAVHTASHDTTISYDPRIPGLSHSIVNTPKTHKLPPRF